MSRSTKISGGQSASHWPMRTARRSPQLRELVFLHARSIVRVCLLRLAFLRCLGELSLDISLHAPALELDVVPERGDVGGDAGKLRTAYTVSSAPIVRRCRRDAGDKGGVTHSHAFAFLQRLNLRYHRVLVGERICSVQMKSRRFVAVCASWHYAFSVSCTARSPLMAMRFTSLLPFNRSTVCRALSRVFPCCSNAAAS